MFFFFSNASVHGQISKKKNSIFLKQKIIVFIG